MGINSQTTDVYILQESRCSLSLGLFITGFSYYYKQQVICSPVRVPIKPLSCYISSSVSGGTEESFSRYRQKRFENGTLGEYVAVSSTLAPFSPVSEGEGIAKKIVLYLKKEYGS